VLTVVNKYLIFIYLLTASPVTYSDSPPGNQLMVNQQVKLSSKPLTCIEEKTVPYWPTHLILGVVSIIQAF